MKLANLYRLETKDYSFELNSKEFQRKLEEGFNLNKKKKNIFTKEFFQYQGTIQNNHFKIVQNNALRSTNDGLYFFCTRVVGDFTEEQNQTKVSLHAEVNELTIGVLIIALIIALIAIFFYHSLFGIFYLLAYFFIYKSIKKQVKKDFMQFEQELLDELKN